MATGDLTFNSFVICDVSEGDVYTKILPSVPAINSTDVVFPNSSGRELRIIGQQNTDATAFKIAYGQSGKFVSAIYKADAATMESFLYGASSSIKALLTDTTSTAIASLVDRDATYTGMRFMSFELLSPITPVNRGGSDKVYVLFQATFARYTT